MPDDGGDIVSLECIPLWVIIMGHRETLGNDGYGLYIDCGDGFMWKVPILHFNRYILYINYFPIKLFKEMDITLVKTNLNFLLIIVYVYDLLFTVS